MKSKYRALNLKICLRLECVYRVLDARGKFGEHEKCVRVARGATESNSGFLSTLQTSRVHPQLDIRTAKSMSKLFYNRATTRICAKKKIFVAFRFFAALIVLVLINSQLTTVYFIPQVEQF